MDRSAAEIAKELEDKLEEKAKQVIEQTGKAMEEAGKSLEKSVNQTKNKMEDKLRAAKKAAKKAFHSMEGYIGIGHLGDDTLVIYTAAARPAKASELLEGPLWSPTVIYPKTFRGFKVVVDGSMAPPP